MSRTTHVLALVLALFTAACAAEPGASPDETGTPDPIAPCAQRAGALDRAALGCAGDRRSAR